MNTYNEDSFVSFIFTSNGNIKNTLVVQILPTHLYNISLNSALIAVQVSFDTVVKYIHQYFTTSNAQHFSVEYSTRIYPPFELNLQSYRSEYVKYPSINFWLKLLTI